MKYCSLGDLHSSAIVMGCMRIGDKPLLQTEELIKTAVSAGVNTFDLADIYGNGNCEKVFGVAVKDIGLSRDSYILQTKCGIRKTEMGKWFDFSKEHIKIGKYFTKRCSTSLIIREIQIRATTKYHCTAVLLSHQRCVRVTVPPQSRQLLFFSIF